MQSPLKGDKTQIRIPFRLNSLFKVKALDNDTLGGRIKGKVLVVNMGRETMRDEHKKTTNSVTVVLQKKPQTNYTNVQHHHWFIVKIFRLGKHDH